jgi:uncharacterized protein
VSPAEIGIEVIYALALQQDVTRLRVPAGTTVGQAIERSNVVVRHPEIGAGAIHVGVYGRRVTLETILRDGDRVEVLRALTADPKEARRLRASTRRRSPTGGA